LHGTRAYPSDKLPKASIADVYVVSGYAGGLTGKIDEVKIFKRVLSSTEAANL
jgi:hypothetical protein